MSRSLHRNNWKISSLLYSSYCSLLLFVVKNLNMFKSNSVVHTIYTRNSSDLYLPSVHLSKVQKSVSLRNQSLQLLTSKNKKFIWRCDEIQISFKQVSFGRFILYYTRIFLLELNDQSWRILLTNLCILQF